MADLRQLLGILGREGVDEVRIETGAPISISEGGRLRPLTRRTLTAEQVREIVRDTPLGPLVPSSDTDGMPELVMVDGEPYIVIVARSRDRLQIRLGRSPTAGAPAPAAAAPAPSPSASSGPRP
ncbi:MAG: hypothetical protein H6712_01705 [Myxococcales bacterium]|nr:hypothetical protein [Myxococcales bacterium]